MRRSLRRREQAAAAGMNSKMFNSFLDGTKSAIEMAAIANATGLTPPPNGLTFPPCEIDDLAQVLRPREDGGQRPAAERKTQGSEKPAASSPSTEEDLPPAST